jgi:hypothetical protein
MERVWREGRYLTVEAAYSLSAVLQGERQLERASEVNDWLHERFPENPVGLYHRARILEGLGRREQALETWQRLAERLVASGRVSHGLPGRVSACGARGCSPRPRAAARLPDAQAAAALALASEHARLRDPEQEMDGPFEEWGDVKRRSRASKRPGRRTWRGSTRAAEPAQAAGCLAHSASG